MDNNKKGDPFQTSTDNNSEKSEDHIAIDVITDVDQESKEIEKTYNNKEDESYQSSSSVVPLTGTHITETDTEYDQVLNAYQNDNPNKHPIDTHSAKKENTIVKQVTFKDSIDVLKTTTSETSICTVTTSSSTLTLDTKYNQIHLITSLPLPLSSPQQTSLPISNTTFSILDTDELLKYMPSKNINTNLKKFWSADDLLHLTKPTELKEIKIQQQNRKKELDIIEKDNEKISERFPNTVRIFDSFTKKENTSEPKQTDIDGGSSNKCLYRRESPNNEYSQSKLDVNRFTEFCSQTNTDKQNLNEFEKLAIEERFDVDIQKPAKFKIGILASDKLIKKEEQLENANVYTATSALDVMANPESVTEYMPISSNTLSCQTSWHDDTSSIILFSSRNISPCNTSHSELQHSLNNYIEPDAAILASSQAKLVTQDVQKVHLTSSTEKLTPADSPPNLLVSTVAVQTSVCERPLPLCSQQYHSIHIDAPSSPPASDINRPSLCSRLWDTVCLMCSAVCLCLQVNRDCIFCLGFFIAFVMTASFLTAFFYRTLTVSPPIYRTTTNESL